MADIMLRLHKDMLVLSTDVRAQLARLGVDAARDTEFTLLFEPEVVEEACKMDAFAGAQCFVAPTATFTPARLAQAGMEDQAADLARAALNVVETVTPQHVLIELGPCGLPLDVASKASLNENLDQYKRAALLFADAEDRFDAFFLNGFARVSDLRCALMGIRKVSSQPIFASVDVDADGALPALGEPFAEAVSVMAEYGAQAVGFRTAGTPAAAAALVREAAEVTYLPVLAQLDVRHGGADDADAQTEEEAEAAAPEGLSLEPDDMAEAADALRAAGAQFLRACGQATPSYAGVLVAQTEGLNVVGAEGDRSADAAAPEPVSDAAARLKAKVNNALGL